MSERHQYKQGDTVRVKPTPSAATRLNGREWPAGFVGYIEGYSWSDHDDVDCPMYWLYGNQNTPAWGITFAESDLELVSTVGQRRAKVPTTQQELTKLQAQVAAYREALEKVVAIVGDDDVDDKWLYVEDIAAAVWDIAYVALNPEKPEGE